MNFLKKMFPLMFLGENRRDNETVIEVDVLTAQAQLWGMKTSTFVGSKMSIKKDDNKKVSVKEDKPIKRSTNPKKKKTLKRNKDVGYVSQPEIKKEVRNYVCQPDIKLSDYNK